MSEVNKNQKDFWSGKGGDIWVERQNAMDTMLSPLGEAALNKLNFNKDENVLDIGCGCGHTTLNIAKRIGPSGKVTGLDISEPMLKRAKESAIEMSITNTFFKCVDVQTEDLGDQIYLLPFQDSVSCFLKTR